MTSREDLEAAIWRNWPTSQPAYLARRAVLAITRAAEQLAEHQAERLAAERCRTVSCSAHPDNPVTQAERRLALHAANPGARTGARVIRLADRRPGA